MAILIRNSDKLFNCYRRLLVVPHTPFLPLSWAPTIHKAVRFHWFLAAVCDLVTMFEPRGYKQKLFPWTLTLLFSGKRMCAVLAKKTRMVPCGWYSWKTKLPCLFELAQLLCKEKRTSALLQLLCYWLLCHMYLASSLINTIEFISLWLILRRARQLMKSAN